MTKIRFKTGEPTPSEQEMIAAGFSRHTSANSAPPFEMNRVHWLAHNDDNALVAALTGFVLWDWLYIDELWVDESLRGQGVGKELMEQAESYSQKEKLSGVWLWTQSWQAEEFYKRLGYQEFARFPDFPKGYFRIGLRKSLG